jgi:NAD(P)H dehydrogenase (quinone)
VLAEAVHRGANEVDGVTAALIAVEDVEHRWDELDAADAIIFGTPTYMGGPSAQFKSFMDATSGRWAERAWTDKLAAAFTNGGGVSGDKVNTLQSLMTFAMQHGMIWVSLGLPGGGTLSTRTGDELNRLDSFIGAMSQAFADVGPEVGPPLADQLTGAALGRRVAQSALRWRAPERVLADVL